MRNWFLDINLWGCLHWKIYLWPRPRTVDMKRRRKGSWRERGNSWPRGASWVAEVMPFLGAPMKELGWRRKEVELMMWAEAERARERRRREGLDKALWTLMAAETDFDNLLYAMPSLIEQGKECLIFFL